MRVIDSSKVGNTVLKVIPYKAEHMAQINPQESQIDFAATAPENLPKTLEIEDLSYSIVNEEGTLISIGGILPFEDQGMSWAVNSDLFGSYVIEITRIVREFFDFVEMTYCFDVITGSVNEDYEAGHKWMKLLKFEPNYERNDLDVEGVVTYERFNKWEQPQ